MTCTVWQKHYEFLTQLIDETLPLVPANNDTVYYIYIYNLKNKD